MKCTILCCCVAFAAIHHCWAQQTNEMQTIELQNVDIHGYTNSSNPTGFINVNGILFFSANDGISGIELWKSDGSDAGTVLVKDINPGSADAKPMYLCCIDSTLYFIADDGVHGSELWQSDGTTNGTTLVKDIYRGRYGSSIHGFMKVNETLYFTAEDTTHKRSLWKSNGTRESTLTVATTKLDESSEPLVFNPILHVHGFIYHASSINNEVGPVLCTFEESTGISEPIIDMESGKYVKYPENLLCVNGIVYCKALANDGTGSRILWKTQNSENSATKLEDMNSAQHYFSPDCLSKISETLYFRAYDLKTKLYGLYRVNDKQKGELVSHKVFNGEKNFSLSNLVEMNRSAYCIANDIEHGTELWRSDGTEEGTHMVHDIYSGKIGSFPYHLTPCGNVLFFTAKDSTHGTELWKTDGTSKGTSLVKDILPGKRSTFYNNFTPVNGIVYFTTNDGVHGYELWKSDGTDAGTVMVKDIHKGAGIQRETIKK